MSSRVVCLEVLLHLVMFSPSALKPTVPQVVKNQPFNIFWASPIMQCQHFFNADLSLQLFNIISNPLETQSGSTIAIFYPNELGYYPYSSQNGTSFNGGIPQNMSLSNTLGKRLMTLQQLPLLGDQEVLLSLSGKAENPRNLGNRIIYKNYYLAFTRNHHPDWLEMKVKTVA